MALSHHTLVAWQRADDLFIKVHALCHAFPDLERYALSSQARRAAYSVAANIVEGFGRRTLKDRCIFCTWPRPRSRNSAAASTLRRLGYISEQTFGDLELDVKKTGAPLSGLIHRFTQASREPTRLPTRPT